VDLRFSLAEATEFLGAVMDLDLRPEDVASLEARTEGWIAGLQLAGLHLQGRADPAEAVRSFAGSHRFVFDYLVEEVLAHLTEPERAFLLQTSILDRMSAELCEVVTEQRASGLMLERLERANLFVVALDDRRQWYRYHHLFADVLRVRLNVEHPENVGVLHRRASDWFAANGMDSEAVWHALSAQDWHRAAELLERAGHAVEDASHAGAWFTHAQALPDGVIRGRPVLAVWYAYALLGRGDLEAAGTYVADAERLLATAPPPAGQALDGSGPPEAEESRSLLARIAVGRGYLAQARGDTAAAVSHARRALELVPDAEPARRDQATALLGMASLARGDLEEVDRVFTGVTSRLLAAGDIADAIDTVCLLAEVRTIGGHLRRAVDTVEQLQAIVAEREVSPPPEMAELYRAWAELDLARGDLAAAAEHLSRSQQFGQLRQMPVWRYRWQVAQAQLRCAQGDPRAALGFLDEAERLFVRTPMPDLRPVAAIRARIWAGEGMVGDALAWARERGLSVDDDLDFLREYEHLTLARILIADAGSGDAPAAADDAVALLDRLLKAALDGARVGSAIEILVAQAVAHEARGSRPEALAALERALALGEAEGYVQVFVDQRPPVAGLLRELVARGSTPDSAARMLAAFPESGDGEVLPAAGALGASPPLSAREVEVLRYIAAGLSNQEIATRMYLSKYTVKAHARTIYDKLEAHSRTAAVARAQQLGILPPR
jgi:LuxR family maltose regulon positive regulatory protein